MSRFDVQRAGSLFQVVDTTDGRPVCLPAVETLARLDMADLNAAVVAGPHALAAALGAIDFE